MRERAMPSKTEYYLFNAFDQMKVYSENGEKYGYYSYDDAGQRMYKVVMNSLEVRSNALGNKILEVENHSQNGGKGN